MCGKYIKLEKIFVFLLKEEVSMKMLSAMIALIAVFQLSACNTLGGVGKDIQRGGEAVEKSTK